MKILSLHETRISRYASWSLISILSIGFSLAVKAAESSSGMAGDLTVDGLSDLVLIDNGSGRILVNQGDGTVAEFKTLTTRTHNIGPISISDLSGDGHPDLFISYPNEAALEAVWGDAYDQHVSYILANLGMETHALAASHGSPPLLAAGFAGSPLIALINYDNNSIQQLYNIQTSYPVNDLLFTDLTGDAIEELVVLLPSAGGSQVQYYQQQPDASWTAFPLADVAGTTLRHMQIGSLNGDGLSDFLLWSSGADAIALLGLAGGGYEPQPVTLETSYQKKAADLNQDGLLDVLAVSPERDAVHVLLNQGNLQFTSLAVPNLSGTVKDVFVGLFSSSTTMDFYVWTEQPPKAKSWVRLADRQNAAEQQLSLYRIQDGAVVPLKEVTLGNTQVIGDLYHNVLIYKKSDIAAGIFYPYGSYFVPDWTTATSPITNGETTVQREVLMDGVLTPDTPVTISGLDFLPNQADYEAHPNQYRSNISEFAFGKPVIPRTLRIEAAPPSGTYHNTITVEPSSEPGAVVTYRLNGVDWQTYTPGSTRIIFYKDGSIDFQASWNGLTSPILTMNYQITQDPSTDSDVDDIPDALEDTFGLPVYSTTPDYDNDGWNDLDELVRLSDPKDPASVPSDSDGDQWSDFDEQMRGTDPNDPASKPAAKGLAVGEYTLTLNSSLQTSRTSTEPVGEGSSLDVWSLAGSRIASATYQGSAWNVRVPGDEPLFFHARENSANTMTLVGYSPTYIPCWAPASIYDGTQSGSQWLESVRQGTGEFLTTRDESISASSMAATLATLYWVERQMGGNTVIHFGDGLQGLLPEQSREIRKNYNLDSVYRHLQSNLPEGHPWTNIVKQVLEWSRDNAPSQDVDITLQQLLLGESVSSDRLPPGLTEEVISQAVSDVNTVLMSIPKRMMELTGAIQLEQGKPVLVTDNGDRWVLNLISEGKPIGSRVTVRGVLESVCSNKPDRIVRVTEIVSDPPEVVFNNDDSDGDGLADQWESFYFARTDAQPADDSDSDGFDNRSEYMAYTNPVDGASNPPTLPTATPTPVIESTPTPTPVNEITPTPTVTPTPIDSLPLIPKPSPIVTYRFSENTLTEAGWVEVPGGYIGNPAGQASLGPLPVNGDPAMSDGQGLILECNPGEVQLVLTLPGVDVGFDPVLIRCTAQATKGTGQLALAALDGSLDGSIGTMIPSDTQHIENQMKYITLLYDPTTTDTLAVVLQLYTPPTSPDSVTVYIDNLEIIPLVPETAIEPSDLLIHSGKINPGPIPLSAKPAPVHSYNFTESSVEEAGFVQVPGGFQAGAIPGICRVAEPSFQWPGSSAGEKGLLFTCNPGETQLVLATPAISVDNQTTLIRVQAVASSGEGNFALVALDGTLDGSIATFIPATTNPWAGQLRQTCLVYQPTKSETVVVGLQLYVPPTASGPVSFYVKQIEVIPFREGTILETANLK